MNSIFLILCTLVIYFFGYRYFARFLGKTIFRIRPAPPAESAAPATPSSIAERLVNAASGRHELLGFHFATIATLTTVSGASIAVYWGWVPAYLWLLVGSSVAAGSFAIGSIWLRRRSMDSETDNGTGTGLYPAITTNLPRQLAPFFLVLLTLALLVFTGLFTYLSAILLVSFPSMTWPLLVTLLVVGLLSRVTVNQDPVLGSRLPSYLVALLVILLSIWISQGKTIGFSGSLNFDLSGGSLVSVDGITAWGILMLLFFVFVQRQPFDGWQKSFGVLTAVMSVLLLILFYLGIAVAYPSMSAPAFSAKSPGLLPWLFITLTTGAYAGLHFLFAYSVTAPKLGQESDTIYIGYGATLLEGLFALSVVLVFGSLIGSKDVWTGLYQSWSGLPDGAAMLGHYVNGVVYAAGQLAVGSDISETWTALVLVCLSMVSSIALLRVLRVLLQELGVRYGVERLGAVKFSSWTAFVLLLLTLVMINGADSIKTLEQVLGTGQYLLASLALSIIANNLANRDQLVLPAWILLAISSIIALVGLGALVAHWSGDLFSFRLVFSLALALLQGALLASVGLKLWKKYRPPMAGNGIEPPEN